MHLDFRSKSFRLVLITVLITVVVTVTVMMMFAWGGVNFFVSSTIERITTITEDSCLADPLIYRGKVYFPDNLASKLEKGELYDQKLATTLWDIGGATSSSNCRDEIPIPPPFKTSVPAMGFNPDPVRINGKGSWTRYGFILHDPEQKLACFVFAGTYHKFQWRDNLKLSLVKAPGINGSSPEVEIHHGFYKNYMAVRQALWSWWSQNQQTVDKLIITGRSLGGALATICSFDFADLPGLEILNYNYASPRVGNPAFADLYNQRVPYGIRIYNTEDLVVDIPTAVFRTNIYKHVGHHQNNRSFTKSLGSLFDNHVEAYRELPI